MSNVDDHAPRSRRNNRPPPPYPYPSGNSMNDDYSSDVRGGRPHRGGDDQIPPAPPIGEALKPAMKRDGSRTRVAPDTRPQFPDEASNAPDLERKNRPRDRQFRDRRNGYESEEGEAHRQNMAPPRRLTDDNRPRGQDPRSRRSYDREPHYPPHDGGRRRGGYDDDEPPRPSRKQRDSYYDDDNRRPRRRGDRLPADIEYGSDPIPARRGSERRPRRRQDDYSDEEEDYRPRRRRSAEDGRRASRRGDEVDYHPDGRRRRDDQYDDRDRDRDRDRRRRDDRSRTRYDEDSDDNYDRRDNDKDKRRGDKPGKPVMIGKYDVGPWIEKGQKHYSTLAPIVTPLVINMARKYMTGQAGGGGGGGGGRR